MNNPRQLLEASLVIASHNKDKIQEISALLTPVGIACESSRSLQLIEPEENGVNYFENAFTKAKAAAITSGRPSLGDDSGIEVDAFLGEPGLHTAPYTQAQGGREAVFAQWAADKNIKANPRAHFLCTLVLYWPDGHYETFFGKVSGNLSFPPRGSGGHGYDPVFIPDGFDRTIGEMSFDEKNICSHRFIALRKMIDACIKK